MRSPLYSAPRSPSLCRPPENPPSAPSDGETLYKENCTRCHITLRTLSARSMRTAMLHMRVKANLTQDETDAIYQYLVGDDAPPTPLHASSAAAKGDKN